VFGGIRGTDLLGQRAGHVHRRHNVEGDAPDRTGW
jgi:hypothetical protein